MRNFLEKLKDFLYDYIDYILMVGIIVLIVSTIGWRLDILFEKNIIPTAKGDELAQEDSSQANGPSSNDSNNSDSNESQKDKTKDETNTDDNPTDNEDENKTKDDTGKDANESQVGTVKVNIPYGSLSTEIGSILKEEGLVKEASEFVVKAQELGLDRKLQSGTFTIAKNSTLTDIIKIIAKQK